MLFFISFLSFFLRVIRKGLRKSSLIFGGPRVSLCDSGLTADHYFWCSSVPGCIDGIPGHYGMFRGCSGVVPGCSGLFRRCSGDVPGCSRGVPGCSGVFRSVPGLFRLLQTLPKISLPRYMHAVVDFTKTRSD